MVGIDTVKGEVLKKIATGGRPHNTLCSPDGKRMYLGPKGSYHVLIADTATHQLIGEIPLSDAPRPICCLERRETAVRQRRHADRLRGRGHQEPQGDPPREADVPAELLRKPSRSHGICLSADEKELWMCDVYHDRTYVFDLTVEPAQADRHDRHEGRRVLDVFLGRTASTAISQNGSATPWP